MNRPERRIQGDFSLPCSTLAFPLGGRWHGAAVTDEGAGFGLNSLCTGEFRRLRAASYFALGGKVTKTPLGDAADGHFVPIGPLTPSPPLRGTRTCKIEENFRRAKFVCPSKFLPPHWGMAKRKIKAGAISLLRLALPSSRLLSLGVGAAHWAAQFRYEIGPIARRGRCPHRPVVGGVAGEMGSFLSAPWCVFCRF